jgi:DNA-directed RNA polymerase specialized sigma24 family protein
MCDEPRPDEMPDLRVQRLIAEADLVEIGHKLSRYAASRIRFYTTWWRREVPGAKEPADFAHEAILDAYCGRRRWDPDRNPDLLDYLRDVVESKVRNWISRREGANVPLDGLLTEPEAPPEARELLLDIERELADEPELWPIVRLFAEGVVKPSDVAEELGIAVEEVINRRKRLRRRLRRLMDSRERIEDSV